MARQCDLILMHILKYGSITHLEAESEYGIARLAARIADLRREGHPITSEMVEGKNRRGEPTHYARYKLSGGVSDG
jgi:hypothetical protein